MALLLFRVIAILAYNRIYKILYKGGENMRIVTLCENRVLSGKLKAMHGLSLYIEIGEHKYLYDVGQEDIFLSNAKMLNIDLKQCEKIIISHGHYDHASGLANIKGLLNKDNFIINKQAFCNKVRLASNGTIKNIGIGEVAWQLKNLSREITGSFQLHKGIWCICNVSLPKESIRVDKGLYIENQNGTYELDDFKYEINLAFETKKGLVVISGCAHCGVINILNEAKRITGVNNIDTFIGGMHLIKASKQEVSNIAKQLIDLKVSRLIVGHCTGVDTISYLKELCGDRIEIIHNYVGLDFNYLN